MLLSSPLRYRQETDYESMSGMLSSPLGYVLDRLLVWAVGRLRAIRTLRWTLAAIDLGC